MVTFDLSHPVQPGGLDDLVNLIEAQALSPEGVAEEDEPQQTPAEIEQEWRAVIRVLQSQVDELRLEVRSLSGRIVIPLGPD